MSYTEIDPEMESEFNLDEFMNSGEFKAGLIIGISVVLMLCALGLFSSCCSVLRICCLDCFNCRRKAEHVYELQNMEQNSKPSAPESNGNGFYGDNLRSFKDK